MSRHASVGFVLGAMLIVGAAYGQESTAPAAAPVEGVPVGYKGNDVPLFFRETWKLRPYAEHGGAVAQKDVSNANLELTLYGAPTDIDPARGFDHGIQLNGGPGVPGTGHLFTGLCDRPCGLALRDKDNFVDLSGFGKIRWSTRVTGLHRVRPVIRLADGTWLLGEHGDGSVFDYHLDEFTLAETRWIAMDMDKVVTRGRWLDKVDLSKVDAIGFVDLLPGSGHGDGGYSNLDWFEVYGKRMPRAAAMPAKHGSCDRSANWKISRSPT